MRKSEYIRPSAQKLLKLLSRQWVSPLSALNILGIYNFSARLSELKKIGYRFECEWVQTPNGKYVKKYRIMK